MCLPGSDRCRSWTAPTSKLHQDSRDSPRQSNVNLHASTKQDLGRPTNSLPLTVELNAVLQWAPFPTQQVLCDDPQNGLEGDWQITQRAIVTASQNPVAASINDSMGKNPIT
jgi:hypothetical protein